MPPEKEALLQKLKKAHESLTEQMDTIKVEKEEMEKEIAVNENARVTVKEKVYPRVRIEFGDQSLLTDTEMGPTIFVLKDGEVTAVR